MVGLRKREPEVGSFEALAYLLGQFVEKFRDNVVRGEAVRVLRFEILLTNNAAVIDVEKSGMRHPFVHTLGFCIENVKAANDLGIRIGQQGKLDVMAIRKVYQDGLAIVANRGEPDALLFELCFCVLQLHQLGFAKRSPVRRTEENDDRPFGTF